MANAINLWVLDRLGLVFANFPNEFAKLTRDGYVLSQMLRSYDIINDDQLGLIKVSEDVNICNQNLMHLRHWLRTIDVTLDLSEITDIVKGRGTASLNIFYKVYLEVHNKERLNYTAQERLNEKLRPVSSFEVNTIEEPEVPLNFYENKLDSVIQYNYDIIHWHQDRLDTMIKKCKQAREQYNNELKKRRGSVLSTDFVATFNNLLDEKDGTEVLNLEQSLNIPYDELCRERKDAKEMVPFIPKLEESMKILKNIRTRQQNHSKEAVLKKQLHKQVLNDFFQSIKQEENDVFRETITEKLIKQSCYEKQMIKKLGEAKMQKEIMLENKQKIADAIAKEKEQEFIEQLLQENKELNNKELQYYLDKERALQLHKRLYEEKLRKRAERHRTLCHDIVEDICNLAMKEAEYKQFYGEGPNESVRNQWKNAFIAGVSPDDFVVPIENIVKEPEQDEEMESIVEKEINRQNAIDQQDLNNYLNFRWPWELANINVDENQIYEMNCGMNVLSNIVYRALETKYPAPTHRPRPNFPELTVVAFVNGLNDLNCIALLQKLLEHRNIIVCEIQDGVTYCVDAYQSEIKIEEDTDTIDVPPEDNRDEESKPKTKNKKRKQKGEKRKSKKGKAEVNPPAVENVFTKVNKISQTPKLFPCEEIPLSQKAELGKLAQEQLTQGLTLTTHLLIDMFIEYLLSKPDMKGWVLLNYPTNYEEAVFLEEALSGVPVPEYIQKNNEIESFSEVNFLNFIQSEPEMEVKHFRDSQLLKKVPKRYEDPFYKTSMTAVVRMIHQEEKKTEDIETEINIVEQEKPNSLMEQFYADAGCLYSMYYTTFDFTALKYLAKLIIGDYTIPPKTSIELFGDTIKYINAEMMYTDADTVVPSSIASSAKEKPKKQQLKLKKTESSSPEKEEKAGKKGKDKGKGKSKGSEKGKGKGKGKKTGKVVIVREDKWTQIPEEEVEIIEVDVLPEPPEPGELEWDYLNLTLREDFEINLATLWENTEECYVEDMKQVFFMKRVLLNNVEPFVHYVRTHMREHVTKPDEKQIYLRNFQTFFNEFDEDIRSDEEFKAEIHCRVHEMKEKLLNICEQRLLETERQRVSLIKTMWPPTHILHFINTYVSSFQLEIDRFVDTLVFVNDYYAGTITNMPCGEILGKESLPRLQIDSSIQEKISKLLISIEEECEDRNPFITKINNIANKCMAFVEKGYQTSSEMINKFKSIFEPKPEKKKSKKDKDSRIPLPMNEENSEKIFKEWQAALYGEYLRARIYIRLLKVDLTTNVKELLNNFQDIFHGIYDQIKTRYDREVQSVVNACNLLDHAVEAEIPIQEELLLKDDQLCVDINTILIPDTEPPEKLLTEPLQELMFTVDQLDHLTDILFDLAPNGIIAERSLTYIIQDMVTNAEDSWQVPRSWVNLIPQDIDKLSFQFFGQQKFVQWRDFITANFMVPYPTVEQILNLRRKYMEFDPEVEEAVTSEHFEEIDLWFEDLVEDNLRVKLLKKLAYKLFKTSETAFNYSAMLLSFCRGETNVEGFAKALSLSLGRPICWDENIGRAFVREIMTKNLRHDNEVQLRNRELIDHKADVHFILDGIIDKTVHICESVIIEEIESESKTKVDAVDATQDTHDMFHKSITFGLDQTDASHRLTDTRLNNTEIDLRSSGILTIQESVKSNQSDESNYLQHTVMDGENVYLGEGEPDKLKPAFANIAVGFEASESPNLAYFLPLDIIHIILSKTILDYHSVSDITSKSKSEVITVMYNELRNHDFHDEVLAHQFLNSIVFTDFLDANVNFTDINPVRIVYNLINAHDI